MISETNKKKWHVEESRCHFNFIRDKVFPIMSLPSLHGRKRLDVGVSIP